MSKSLHRSIAGLLLLVLFAFHASAVFAAHAYPFGGAASVASHAGEQHDAAPQAKAAMKTDAATPGDARVAADCAEHCTGAAIPMTRPTSPTLASRGERILPPAIVPTAAPPERLERPPKSAHLLA